MKYAIRTAAALFLGAGLAACDGIGDGSTVEKFEIVVSPIEAFEQGVYPVEGDTTTFRMYDCFCSNAFAIGTFSDGTQVNFNGRATFTSDAPDVVSVQNFDDEDAAGCPFEQQGPGLLVPKGVGTATITVSFAGLSDTLEVVVADASQNQDGSPASYVLQAAPPADSGATDVAVGATLRLRLLATLDGRQRNVTDSVTAWSFDNEDDSIATVSAAGVVTGVGPTAAAPRVVRAAFGACTDVSATLAVNVGDVVEPLALEREAPDFATDGMLAVASDERLTATAPLDFDGDGSADGSQLFSDFIGLTSSSACTLREFDATVPTTNCRETATVCQDTVSTCGSSSTTCTSGMTACRVLNAPLLPVGGNLIRSIVDRATGTSLQAVFPERRGLATTLAADVADGAATTVEVTALEAYPTTFPWYAVIDKDGAREDVRVTAVDGTTLTVARGVGGTTAAAHAAGVTFEQRSYGSDPNAPLVIQAKEGTLTTIAIEPPGTLTAGGERLQLSAQGTFVDDAAASRQQRVTRLQPTQAANPTVTWQSSAPAIANFSVETPGLLVSLELCGGEFSVRARATTSTDDSTEFFDPDTAADDDACENTDPLCDQVEMCVPTPSPLPLGVFCDAVTTC